MELRCPGCCSPEVESDRDGSDEAGRCANCGATFEREAALVTVGDAESRPRPETPWPQFTLDRKAAAIELRRECGAIGAVDIDSDADELNAFLESAQTCGVIVSECEDAQIYVYPLSLGHPEPLLAVDPGAGPTLLGHSQRTLQGGRGRDLLHPALPGGSGRGAGRLVGGRPIADRD